MTGMSAAKTLKQRGFQDFLIIEGSSEVGGRAKQQSLGDYKVQLGCMWLHGSKSQNPLWNLVVNRNISVVENDYDDWIVYDGEGVDKTSEADAIYENTLDEALEKMYAYTMV